MKSIRLHGSLSSLKRYRIWHTTDVIKSISDDPQVLIFTTALITNTLIVIVLYKYSRMLELSLYVYITGGLF